MRKICVFLVICAMLMTGSVFAQSDFSVDTTLKSGMDDEFTVIPDGDITDAMWIILTVEDGDGVPVYTGQIRPEEEVFNVYMDEESSRTRTYDFNMMGFFADGTSKTINKKITYYSFRELQTAMALVMDGSVSIKKLADILSVETDGVYNKINNNTAVVNEMNRIGVETESGEDSLTGCDIVIGDETVDGDGVVIGTEYIIHEDFKEVYAKALMNLALKSKDADTIKVLMQQHPTVVGIMDEEGTYIPEMTWYNKGNKNGILGNVAKYEYDTPEAFLESFKFYCFTDKLVKTHSSALVSFLRENDEKYVDFDFEEFDSKLGTSVDKIDYAVEYILDKDRDISTPEKLVGVFNTAIDKAKDYKPKKEELDGGSGGGGGGGGNVFLVPTEDTAGNVPSASNNNIFSDLGNNHWAKAEIEALYHKGIVNGRGDGRFDPDASITREEFVSIIVKAFGLTGTSDTIYGDVVSGAWYENAIMVATANEIVSGYDGMFGIGQNITREDMAVILYRIAKKLGINISATIDREIIDKDSVSDYAYEASDALYKAGIINGMGNGMFEGKSNASRAQAAKLIYTMLNR